MYILNRLLRQETVGGLIMSVTDLSAAQKWAKLTKDNQQLLVRNVFCSVCGVTTIVKYTLHDNKYGILLKGKCKKCGRDVARLVEDK
jgi:transcription elongation factor Elf1